VANSGTGLRVRDRDCCMEPVQVIVQEGCRIEWLGHGAVNQCRVIMPLVYAIIADPDLDLDLDHPTRREVMQ